ncbi:MAG: DUF2334 domain-containing protein, partial [Euryarchaeota archaeon]|nr:DUF2334 domain-containing protein [Euryarchaeota archaeon]
MNTNRLFSFVVVILLLSALLAMLPTIPAAARPNSSVQASNMKHIIFRDDDIAPYAQLDALKAVNQVHIDKNVPVTMGIVAHPDPGVYGNELLADADALSYLQSLATNPLFEFAQHGYTHSDSAQNTAGTSTPRMVGTSQYADRLVGAGESSEFRGRSYAEQYNKIKQGRDDISTAFEVTPTTFIPPWNTGDINTLKACAALGFTLYSTNEADFGVADATIEGIRVQAASLEFPWTETDWNSYMSDLISKTDATLNAAPNGASVVVLYHFWAFRNSGGSIDPNRIAWLGQYIDHLRDRGDVQFATLSGQKPSSFAAPAVCAQDANSLDVFVRGGDSALWWKHWDGDTWSAWESLGGVLSSSPAATSRSSGTLDVYVRGSDGALWELSYTSSSGGWGTWSKIG